MNKLLDLSLLSPVFIPFIISVLLFFNASRNNNAKKFLALFMFNISLLFAGLYILFFKHYNVYAAILPVHVFQLLIVFPGVYIYVKKLIDNKYSINEYFIHLCPALIMIPEALIYYFALSEQEQYDFVTKVRYEISTGNIPMYIMFYARKLNIVIILIQFALYWFLTHKTLKKYTETINNIFSNTEGISLNSIKIINNVLLIGSLSCMGFYALNPIKLFNSGIFLIIALGIISLAIFFLGIIGLRQNMLPGNIEANIPDSDTKSNVHNNTESQLFDNLSTYFTTHKPYLQPDLRIDNLIKTLATNRTHLSNTINKNAGKNFNLFVNEFRINEAKELITKQGGKVCYEDISENSGFGSVRSFERNFKNIEGISVGDYIKTIPN